jgi:DNA invertase Pin-like site-specific DNA recombinase
MRVATYIRMSTGRQEHSPARQREAIAAHAAKHGYAIVREYADLAVSGDKAERRPQFLEMIADATSGEFDRILCFDRARFGRFDSLELGKWCCPLRDAGVALETVADGLVDWNSFGGRIVDAVQQEGKHTQLVDLARNTVTGLTRKASNLDGVPGAPPTFGFIRRTEIRKGLRHSTLEIDPVQASVVRRIFREYAKPEGSVKSVACALNRDRVPSARGGVWSRSAVGQILQNPIHCGDVVYGKRAVGDYASRAPDGGIMNRKKGQGAVKCATPIVHHDASPAIVSRELWNRCQVLLKERAVTRKGATSQVRPLSGLVICGLCGKKLRSDGDRYRCNKDGNGFPDHSCSSRRFRASVLVNAVAAELQERLLAPAVRSKIKAAIERQVAGRNGQAKEADLRPAIKARITAINSELAAGVAKIPMMPDAVAVELGKRLESLTQERSSLESQLAALRSAGKGSTQSETLVRAAIKAMDDVATAIASGNPVVINAVLRQIGLTVTVAPEPEADGRRKAAVSCGNLEPHVVHDTSVSMRPTPSCQSTAVMARLAAEGAPNRPAS